MAMNSNAFLRAYPSEGAVTARTRSVPTHPVRTRPSAGAILILLGVFLLPVALVPSSYGRITRLPPFPHVWWTVNLIFAFAAFVVLFRWLGGYCSPVARSTKRWLLVPVLLLGVWQTISLTWNGRDNEMRLYSFLESATMCAAVLSGVLLVSGISPATRLRVGRGVTFLVAFIIAVYVGLSFVFPSWRPSSAWMDRTADTLGFIRVFGPLGAATTLNFMLVPALGFSAGMVFVPGRHRVGWGLLTGFFLLAILGTGSRGGILCLAAFAVLLTVALRLRAMVLLVPLVVLIGCLIMAFGVPERFRSLEDDARLETYKTGLRAYTASPENVVLGLGHGAMYSKLHDESMRTMLDKKRWYLIDDSTPYGYTLRSSHALFLRGFVETGVIGLGLLVAPLVWIGLKLVRSALAHRHYSGRSTQNTVACAGCAAVIPYMAFDEFLIHGIWLVVIWTLYVVIAAETVAPTQR